MNDGTTALMCSSPSERGDNVICGNCDYLGERNDHTGVTALAEVLRYLRFLCDSLRFLIDRPLFSAALGGWVCFGCCSGDVGTRLDKSML